MRDDRSVEAGELLWSPTEELAAVTNVALFSTWLEESGQGPFAEYEALRVWALEDLGRYWLSVCRYFDVRIDSPPVTAMAGTTIGATRWFEGATVNYAGQALRHQGPHPAIVAHAEGRPRRQLSWDELRAEVGAFARHLVEVGVGPGDRVVAICPNIPEAVVALLATASIGAVWSCCPPEFGVRSILDRFSQIEPTVLVAVDGYRYGGRDYDIGSVLTTVEEALPSLRSVVRIANLSDPQAASPSPAPSSALTTWWHDVTSRAGPIPEIAELPFDHPLWILYTSGTSGRPRGVLHGHGGAMLEQMSSMAFHNDVRHGGRLLFQTSSGWVVWNMLVGGLLLGSTIVLFDGSPDGDLLWTIAASEEVDVFGAGAAYFSRCAREGRRPGEVADLSSLRVLWSTGGGLSVDDYGWVYDAVKRDVWLCSASGATELVGPTVGGCPTLPLRAGEIQCRCLGVDISVLDDDGAPVEDGAIGELVVSAPMPSMPLGLWGDDDGSLYHEIYLSKLPGHWYHGDLARLTEHGSLVLFGRSDATLKRHGVRIGSAELYGCVEDVDGVEDSLVVDVKGADGTTWLVLVVAPVEDLHAVDQERLRGDIVTALRRELSPRHVPDVVAFVDRLPRTFNGKKVEIPAKRLLAGADADQVVDLHTLTDPDAFLALRDLRPLVGGAPPGPSVTPAGGRAGRG